MLRADRSRETRASVRYAAGFSFLVAWLVPRLADAGGPLGPQGSDIKTSAYSLDLFQGPVLASARVVGMAGAYDALAEGAEGIPFNPAAASQRYPYSSSKFDYELTASITFPSSVAGTDFENNGKTFGHHQSSVWGTVGVMMQNEHLGFGTIISLQNYAIVGPSASPVKDLTVRVFKVDSVFSYGFFRDQLHVGGGLRGAIFNAVDTSASVGRLLLGTYGVGAQSGVLWRPRTLPLRLGGTVRSPVLKSFEAGPSSEGGESGDRVIGGFYLPTGVDLPWEAECGVAIQFGERPLNLGWTDETTLGLPVKDAHRVVRARYRAIPREKLLLTFGTLITGPTKGAVGVSSMLAQQVDRSGERSSVTLRGGGEAEVLRDRLQLRAGSYMEPTRFRQSSPRLHGTIGFEVRVLDWSAFGIFPEDNRFRISGAIDGARGYFGWSLAVGSWY